MFQVSPINAFAYSGDEVMLNGKKASPLKLGNETYGNLKIEKAFLKALELYFIKQQDQTTQHDQFGDFFTCNVLVIYREIYYM